MLVKEYTHTEHTQKNIPEFHEPETWLGHAPKKGVKICFAATHVEAWEQARKR
jgi:hypothetical protein